MQESISSLPVDRVRSHEPFDLGLIADLQLCGVQMPDLGVLVTDPVVFADAVKVAAFHHERTWTNQRCHFSVVESTAEIPFEDFVFARPDVAEVVPRAGVLQHPLVEIRRAD